MNEDLKNIETCLPESILAEVASVPTDPQFVSLVNESLDPLKQQAADREGWDAYNEVVASHQPYTFTSSVRQMKSNLILLLRRLWRFPFGSGTIRSLSDMWQHYISRLSGNETYGIPSRLDQLTDLPSAPLLVADRKISEPNAIDGISLAQILCSAYHPTEIEDTNKGWTMTKALTWDDLTTIQLGCGEIANNVYVVQDKSTVTAISLPHLTMLRGGISKNCANVASISVPNLEEVTTQYMTAKAIANSTALTHIEFPKLRKITQQTGLGQSCETNTMFYGCSNLVDADFPVLEELAVFSDYNPRIFAGCGVQIINMPNLTKISNSGSHGNAYMWFSNLPNLRKIVFGKLETCAVGMFDSCPCLVHLEIGDGTAISMNFSAWNPTTALANNLQQFLQNFRSFIVLRLANRKTTTALTLTLSAAVYNAVTGANSGWASQHTLADLGITDNDLTDLETELGITSATIYATWLDTYTGANGIHWNVNKAN